MLKHGRSFFCLMAKLYFRELLNFKIVENMKIIQVTDKTTVDDFRKVPERIYTNDPNCIPSLQMLKKTWYNDMEMS